MQIIVSEESLRQKNNDIGAREVWEIGATSSSVTKNDLPLNVPLPRSYPPERTSPGCWKHSWRCVASSRESPPSLLVVLSCSSSEIASFSPPLCSHSQLPFRIGFPCSLHARSLWEKRGPWISGWSSFKRQHFPGRSTSILRVDETIKSLSLQPFH